jgi:hypothetical protein
MGDADQEAGLMATDHTPLTVGEQGWYCQFGKHYPARVLANDVRQTFGAIDALVAWQEFPTNQHEHVARLVQHEGWVRNPVTNGHWVSDAEYREARAKELRDAIAVAQKELEAVF